MDVDGILDRLTLEEKVGQLLLISFGGTKMDATIADFLHEMKPGGVALFARNIETPAQTLRLIRDVRDLDPVSKAGALPLFVAVDQEGGNVVRLKQDATILPSAMALGAADDVELARRAGVALGRDLRLLGFNMNLAPVLDVNSNPRNPVIGIRSFGERPDRVAEIGVAYIQGIQSQDVVAVAKHFPGHGDTDADSHYHLPVLRHGKERLDSVELLPFARAFAEGLDAIMTAHIALPALAPASDADRDLPATLNPRILTNLLREELAYDGLVMTDGLEMQGIVQRFGVGEAAVRAVLAGADIVMILWYPKTKREVRNALIAAVQQERIPMWRLDQSVRRVLVAKARRGLFGLDERPMTDVLTALRDGDRSVVEEIAARAVTVARNEQQLLPLKKGKRVVVATTEPIFAARLQRQLGARVVPLSAAPTRARAHEEVARVVALSEKADVVVIGVQNLEHASLVERLRALRPAARIVLVSFGSPYMANLVPPLDAYVCAFGWREESERAAAQAIVGATPPGGTLPVTISSSADSDSDRPPAPRERRRGKTRRLDRARAGR